MGKRIVGYFAEADRIGGLPAKMHLALETKVTSARAAAIEDDPQLCARFETALAGLRSQFGRAEAPPLATSPETTGRFEVAGRSEAAALRRHISTYLDLMSQRSLVLGSVTETVRRVNEAAAHAIDSARVSVWFCDEARSKITCVDLYERATGQHSAGVELFAKDFPAYFAALRLERTIAAHDAHHDARTSCFSQNYLAPLGIGAMLDVPIWHAGAMVGVVCHEHVGGARTWSGDEETFAYLMSNFVALAMEFSAR